MREAIDGVEYWRTQRAQASRVPFLRECNLMWNLERRVDTVARQIRPDIIHAHSPVLVGLPALRVARRLGIRMVYEIRDLWENASVDRGRFSSGSPLYHVARRLETHVVSHADAIVTICDLLKYELAPRAGRAGKVHVIANGVDAEGFQPQNARNELKERWGLAGKEVILYAGTFQPYEGLDLLIRALELVVRNRPSAHLVIVGGTAGFAGESGPMSAEQAALLSVVRDNGLMNQVTFTGRIAHADVKEMYALAEVVTYPRLATRTTAMTTPLKPLEAMAMAKPVIVSDLPALRELVSDGVTGLLFSAGNRADLAAKCTQLLADAQLRQRLGCEARAWVLRERQWPALIAKYRGVYDSVLDPRVRETARSPQPDARIQASLSR